MKRLSIFALIVSLFIFGAVRVNAKTEEELKKVLTQTIKVNGKDFTLSDEYKALIERYLNEYDISSEHADYIARKVEEAKDIVLKQKSVDFKNYPQNIKDDLKKLVEDISANTSVKATLERDGLVVYKGKTNEVFDKIDDLVKQTGTEASKMAIIVGFSILIVAVGTGLVIKQVKTSE